MKILILDDHPLFSSALKQIVQNINEVQIIDIATNVDEALNYFNLGNSYDLLLVDIGLSGLDGFSFMSWLRTNLITTPVIVISASNDPDIATVSIQKGAQGFIHKSEDINIIIQGIKQVKQGHTFTSSNFSNQPSTSNAKTQAQQFGITPRQLNILQLLDQGDSNKEIARKLNISDSTVKKHISNILSLLCVQNRTALVLEARRLELI